MRKQPLAAKDMSVLARYGLQDMDLAHAVCLKFKPGEYIHREGETAEFIYLVSSGKAKVLLSLSNGRQLLLAFYSSQGIIGEVELMVDAKTAYTTMQAVTDFVCIAIPVNLYRATLKSNITFMNYIAGELAEKLIQRGVNDANTMLQPLEARLCAYLSQTEINGYFHETLTDVAGMMGASYRHLLRSFEKLCNDGVLQKESPGYRIRNRQTLVDKAGDLYLLKWSGAGNILI